MAGPAGAPLVDRRAGPRAPARFLAEWSDHAHAYSGEALNFGPGGLFVTGTPLPAGQALRIRLELPGQEPLEIAGQVVHAASDGLGLSLDVRTTKSWERTSELFERHIASDPSLVARVRRQVRRIEAGEHLWPTRAGLTTGAARTPHEKRVLHALGDGRTLEDLRAKLGPAFAAGASWSLLALLERDAVTTSEPRAARGRPPPDAGPTRKEPRSGKRPQAAEQYLKRAREERAAGRNRAAITALRLALSLCPDDPEIEAELARLTS